MYKYFKRFIDFMIAFVALIVLFIPLTLIAILIKLDSKGPVLFKQERLGKNGVPFVQCLLVQRNKDQVFTHIKVIVV